MFTSLSSGEEATEEQTVFILQKTALDHFGAKNCIQGLIYKKLHLEPYLLQWPRSQQKDITLPLSNPPKDPLGNSAGVKHLKIKNGPLQKMDIKIF